MTFQFPGFHFDIGESREGGTIWQLVIFSFYARVNAVTLDFSLLNIVIWRGKILWSNCDILYTGWMWRWLIRRRENRKSREAVKTMCEENGYKYVEGDIK